MTAAVGAADLVHSHTWYANLAGYLASLLYGVPHVVTVHSLEPLRPWKAEQLGGGYALSSWCERTAVEAAAAVIAVSDGMRDDVLAAYPAVPARAGAGHPQRHRHGRVLPRPGDRRAGAATASTRPGPRSCSSAGSPGRRGCRCCCARRSRRRSRGAAGDLRRPGGHAGARVRGRDLARELRASRDGVVWISGMLAKREVIQLLTHATVFACPSLYEPLGIVNLEAMACGTAVVGSKVGGIPEVVADGETGLLVPPGDPAALAHAVNELVTDEHRAAEMGRRGRARAEAEFGWAGIAAQTRRALRRARGHLSRPATALPAPAQPGRPQPGCHRSPPARLPSQAANRSAPARPSDPRALVSRPARPGPLHDRACSG